jgi:hypothetical protein
MASELTSTSANERGIVGEIVIPRSESSESSGTCTWLCFSVPAMVAAYGRDDGVEVGWLLNVSTGNVLLDASTGLEDFDTLDICGGLLNGCSSETCCLSDSSSACSSFLLEHGQYLPMSMASTLTCVAFSCGT